MGDVLKLSSPQGTNPTGNAALGAPTPEDQIAQNLSSQDMNDRIKQLEKNNADLKKLLEEKSKRTPSGNKIGARKNANFKAVSTAPSINKTPMGNSTPPVPYPTTQDLSNSTNIVPSVNFAGDPAYTIDRTTQPSGKGDDPGTADGVKSGTVNGEVKPTGASSTVRAEGDWIVRENDPCTMNGGNNPGIYVTTLTPSPASPKNAAATSNPPVKPETANEKSALRKWWDKSVYEMGQAIEHPGQGLLGALKGIGNIPSDIAQMMVDGAQAEAAGDMMQSAAMQGLTDPKGAEETYQAAQQMMTGGSQIEVPKFTMNNPAQAGGDKISTVVQLLAGGEGLVKGGVGALGTIGKVGKAAEVAGDAGKTAEALDAAGAAAKTADAAKGAEKAATPVEEGVKIPPKISQKILYRGDGRSPETIFKEGFESRGTSTDLKKYVDTNEPSAFVGTSKDLEEATTFAENNDGYVYHIDSTGLHGVDVNAEYPANIFSHEQEIAILGGIPNESIISAQKVMPGGGLGPVILNPLYKGVP